MIKIYISSVFFQSVSFQKLNGGTTVSTTLAVSKAAGVPVMVTGNEKTSEMCDFKLLLCDGFHFLCDIRINYRAYTHIL